MVVAPDVERPLVVGTDSVDEWELRLQQRGQDAVVLQGPLDAQQVLLLDGIDQLNGFDAEMVGKCAFDVVDLGPVNPEVRNNDPLCRDDSLQFDGYVR